MKLIVGKLSHGQPYPVAASCDFNFNNQVVESNFWVICVVQPEGEDIMLLIRKVITIMGVAALLAGTGLAYAATVDSSTAESPPTTSGVPLDKATDKLQQLQSNENNPGLDNNQGLANATDRLVANQQRIGPSAPGRVPSAGVPQFTRPEIPSRGR